MSMKRKRRIPTYNAIAIIGNGFDLAHGYKTTYPQFVSAVGEDFFANFRKYLDEYCGSSPNWYDFENRIRDLTLSCFLQSYQEDGDYEKGREDLEKINEEFDILHEKLKAYLIAETSKTPKRRLPLVKRRLTKHTLGINFNYTSTAEEYLRHILYVHGSLRENNIILGYDFRDEPCLAGYDEMRWSKSICRERIAFRRHINHELKICPNEPTYEKLICDFDAIESMRYSSKGFDLDEDIAEWENRPVFEHYLKEVEKGNALGARNVRYDRIKKIVVLGHSIQADRQYLSTLLKRCVRLRKVVIFSYLGESEKEWKEKEEFFKPYCKKIVKVRYA